LPANTSESDDYIDKHFHYNLVLEGINYKTVRSLLVRA